MANTEINQASSSEGFIEINFANELGIISETDLTNQAADIYIWEAEDHSGDEEHIAHFTPGQGGDVLQLNNLFFDRLRCPSLDQFLHFHFDGTNTKIEIRTQGEASNDSHFIVLDNVDLRQFGQSDNEIIHQLMDFGNLDIVGFA